MQVQNDPRPQKTETDTGERRGEVGGGAAHAQLGDVAVHEPSGRVCSSSIGVGKGLGCCTLVMALIVR
mgnify:CR=1 FL=1